MGMGGTGDKLASREPKLLGVDESRTNTSDQGRVLPYLAGKGPLAGTFIDEAWGVRTEAITRKVGKKKQVTGYNYFCSFAIIYCHGAVDYLDQIRIDGQVLWEGPLARGGNDYTDVTISGRGTFRIFWGTETQDAGTYLTAEGCPNSHPGYRGQCLVVFSDWLLGENKTSVPNFELVLRRQPVVSWVGTTPGISDDANVVHIIAEMWENRRFGCGLDPDRLNQTEIDTAAATIANEGVGVSPIINNATSFTQFLATCLDYLGGYHTSDANGLFTIRLMRAGDAPSVDVDEDALTEPPKIESNLWWDTYNQVFVKFRNRSKNFQDDGVSWRDRGNFAITGVNRTLNAQRPWITRQLVAWYVAACLSKKNALPFIEGSIRVRRDVGYTLAVGDVFRLSYGVGNLSLVECRVTSWMLPKPESAEVEIGLVEDRGYLTENLYEVAADADLTEEEFTPEVPYDQLALELPFAYMQSRAIQVALLPARGDPLSSGFNYYREASTLNYVQDGSSNTFGFVGTISAELPITTLLEAELPITVELEGPDLVLPSVTYEEALTTEPLTIFLGDEILLAYDLTLVSAGVYTMKVLRARYGTRRRTHAAGAEVWLFRRTLNPIVTSTLAASVTSQNFKLQPFLQSSEVALADCPALNIAPQRRSFRPPPPANLQANGDGVNPTYGTGTDVVMSWTETSDEASFSDPLEILTPRCDTVVLRIYTTGGTLVGTVEVAGSAGPYTLTNAALVGFLGSQVSFKVRAWARYAGLESLDYEEITVWKV